MNDAQVAKLLLELCAEIQKRAHTIREDGRKNPEQFLRVTDIARATGMMLATDVLFEEIERRLKK